MIVDGRESSSETSKILYLTKSNLSPPLYHLCTTFVSSCRQYALLHNVYIMTYRRSLLCSRLSFYNHEFVVYRFEATTILYQKRTNIHVGLVAKLITLSTILHLFYAFVLASLIVKCKNCLIATPVSRKITSRQFCVSNVLISMLE